MARRRILFARRNSLNARSRFFRGAGSLLLWASATAAVAQEPPRAASLADCDQQVAARPESLEAWRCFWDLGRRNNMMAAVEHHLDALLAREPDNHRARLQLGAVLSDQTKERAEGVFREAAEGMEAEGELRGAVYARGGLAYFYRSRSRLNEALAQNEKMLALAQRTGAVDLLAEARIDKGFTAFARDDYGSSYVTFRQVILEEDLKPWPYLRGRGLSGLAASSWALGKYEDALSAYQELAAMNRASGNRFGEAATRVNIALATLSAGIGTPESRRALAEEALQVARESGNRDAEAGAEIHIGNNSPLEEAGAHYETALRIKREIGLPEDIVIALERVSVTRRDGTPAGLRSSFAAIDEAIALAHRHGLARRYFVSLSLRARRRWESGPRAQAIAESLEAIAAAESMRRLQLDDAARAAGFTTQFAPYYELAAHVLEPLSSPPSPSDVQLSFATIERMRARRLLELLESAEAPVRGATAAAEHALRDGILKEMTQVQRQLLNRRLDDTQRRAALIRLEQLELREREIRIEIARQDPVFAALRAPEAPPLAQVQSELRPDEALLSYQITGWTLPYPGNWILLITRDATRAVELPRLPDLERRVAFFSAALAAEDPAAARIAALLHAQILAPALAHLPGTIHRLIVIPDGPLHEVSFAALRDPGGEPAGVHYALSVAPSVTTWMRWRRLPPAPGRVLALADPTGVPMAALPYARQEAAATARRMNGAADLVVGAGASEEMLRARDLGGIGVLHLATHAIVDYQHPGRSGVLLAGGPEQDGLVQPREIAGLSLSGKLVVLSGCRGASGSLLRGEGVMGLAHAFFQAGARAVVGSLWPLRDDMAAALLDRFYEALARGSTADEALSSARAQAIRSGLPAAGWAGLELLGDGSIAFTPRTESAPDRPGRAGLLMASLACGAAALLLVASPRRS